MVTQNSAPNFEQLPLRDIHLPEPVGWWPPAIGWWLLLLIVILMVFLCYGLWRRRQARRLNPKRAAQQALNRIHRNYKAQPNTPQLTKALSTLLRRTCLSLYPRRDCASLTGDAWLAFLDQLLNDHRFSQGPGQVLAESPYQAQPQDVDATALLALCGEWVNTLPDTAPEEQSA